MANLLQKATNNYTALGVRYFFNCTNRNDTYHKIVPARKYSAESLFNMTDLVLKITVEVSISDGKVEGRIRFGRIWPDIKQISIEITLSHGLTPNKSRKHTPPIHKQLQSNFDTVRNSLIKITKTTPSPTTRII